VKTDLRKSPANEMNAMKSGWAPALKFVLLLMGIAFIKEVL